MATVSRKDGTPSAMGGCMITWIAENQPTRCSRFAKALGVQPNSASSVLRMMSILGWVIHTETGDYVLPNPGAPMAV